MIKFVKFAELPVSNQDRAVSFYTEKVGLKVVRDSPYKDGWRWIELEILYAETRIMLTERPDEAGPDVLRLVLIVGDVNETYQELAQKGVVFTKGPTQTPRRRQRASKGSPISRPRVNRQSYI